MERYVMTKKAQKDLIIELEAILKEDSYPCRKHNTAILHEFMGVTALYGLQNPPDFTSSLDDSMELYETPPNTVPAHPLKNWRAALRAWPKKGFYDTTNCSSYGGLKIWSISCVNCGRQEA